MKKIIYAFTLLLFAQVANAQVGINILNPDSSAVLQLESNNKGLGLSRLTSPQRDAISNPLKGLTIYNTQDSVIEYWNGECWLKVWQKNCYECDFTMSINDPTDTLDRLTGDSVSSTITVNQTNGTADISIIYLASLPQGVSVYFNGNTTIDSSGTLDIVVKADMCSPVGGNYPIIIQAFCDNAIHFLTYNVYIRPPVQFTIPADVTDYNMQQATGLPAGSSQFALLNINGSVTVRSSVSTAPAFTVGNLAANSLVCINNDGDILGRGGDGGAFNFNGGLLIAGGNAGDAGGDAMHLTTRTILNNNGAIYGGGSGGGSVGFAIGTPSIPLIGSIVIGFGLCGGGGSELGQGGVTNPNGVTLGVFQNGGNATCCVTSTPGLGPNATYPISIPISVASVNITPNGYGGDGGGFGQQGTQGYIDVDIDVCVSIPFLGNICIPIPIPGGFLPFYGPSSGLPGKAIKRNGNPLTGVADGNYSSSQYKGVVSAF